MIKHLLSHRKRRNGLDQEEMIAVLTFYEADHHPEILPYTHWSLLSTDTVSQGPQAQLH